jgi:diaminohydroxyphosphoribosylaminopyrimidine deaminase / 5-amino-6-(5-phosphoribosylamino)uracil reductase
MRLALELASKGGGHVEPNPLVGCVIARGDELLGSGYHRRFGGPHAEREALAQVAEAGNAHRLADATAYVTLEPCCHFGKTPPCTDALLESNVSRVVVAMLDPFEHVAGQGVALLRSAGLQVDLGCLETEASLLNAPYLKRLRQQRPWVIGKWAMSLDGKTATHTGHSQWISGEASRAFVHELRGRMDAIIVGSGTAIADNPQLTARTADPPRIPLRVVVDSQLQLPLNCHLVATARSVPTLLWCGPSANPADIRRLREQGCSVEQCTEPDPNTRLERMLEYLVTEHRTTNALIEGGSRLLGSLVELGQLDESLVFIAPKLIGGAKAVPAIAGLGFANINDGPSLLSLEHRILGEDAMIRCRWDWKRSRRALKS